MDWNSYHNRAAVLRDLVTQVEARGGAFPLMDAPGVRACFRDELDVVGALQLRWHSRLVAQIEAELHGEPRSLESAVVTAWRTVAQELPGVRAVIDRYVAEPVDATMAKALATARSKEHALLALMSGLASDEGIDAASQAAGAALERKARATLDARPLPVASAPRGDSLLTRLRQAVVA